jgi:2,3-bisphosphoglycerate-independent phosphoglycerate mutase
MEDRGHFPDMLALPTGGRIVMLVLDGLGGLPHAETGLTELEAAATPNLDRLARASALGLHRPVGYGITPGSGPGHLSLFGYDPVRYNIGRGVLSALGVGFAVKPGDIAIRLNFATHRCGGHVTDRRAGRPSDAENRRLVAEAAGERAAPGGVSGLLRVGEGAPRGAGAARPAAVRRAGGHGPAGGGRAAAAGAGAQARGRRDGGAAADVLDAAFAVLRDEPRRTRSWPAASTRTTRSRRFEERYRLRARAIAKYPMYRGVARLVGMDGARVPDSDAETVDVLATDFDAYDFHFVHFKAMDSRGEDGDFEAKARRSRPSTR